MAKAKTPTQEVAQTGERKLKQLLKTANESHKNMQEISGTLGQQIADAVENNHLHKKAFATLRSMDRMTPQKLADFWDTLQYYVDISGLGDRAASAPKLPMDAGDDEDDVDDKTGKVRPFPKPTSVAAE